MAAIDLTGQTFGFLTVVKRSGISSHGGEAQWLCRCVCGNERIIRSDKLRGGQKSCGCYRPPQKKKPKPSEAERARSFKQKSLEREDLTGMVFERLTVIRPVVVSRGRRLSLMWRCKCACGSERLESSYKLKGGRLRSCGCLRSTHGMANSSEYRIWGGIIDRCRNPNNNNWHNYGGRGIEVRFKSFEEFYAEIGPRPHPLLTVDRINNNGHYERGNLRWATRSQQVKNRRSFKNRITHCKRGHELTPENVSISKRGYRRCKKCNALKTAEYVANNRELAYARSAKWRAANLERAREASRRWHRKKTEQKLSAG